ncbi:MMPL family transporter [Blastopirellula sp. JC732]|uniref:MMPL family transporter n=1 Tax=Blastopirellula sediminis TaxID=2894196 RepID=A0A9X1MPG9_9BACT|nr:MMPL family transporter [Blastopirellula sediminis]MCC9606371.1 MMPL family transporter [Blastopirellula sediminis]MCC9630331.1 MMPL family transporter [Blastopirellula sediminis]
MLDRLIELLVRFRVVTLILGICLLGISLVIGQSLSFDRSIDNMFASGDPLLAPYLRLKEVFGGNEVVLAVYPDPELFDESGVGMDRLIAMRKEIMALEGVRDVLSIDRPIGKEIVNPDNNRAIKLRDTFVRLTHNEAGDIAALVCILVPESETKVTRTEIIDQIRSIVAQQPGGMITGEPVMVVDGFRYVEEDGARLGWATSLLLGLVILIAFRSVRWVIAAIAVVQLTLWLTQASLAVAGFQLSMVSSMLTAIVTVIGVATVTHVLIRFREFRAQGLEPEPALIETGKLLATPIFWACATDAVGFSALMVTKVGPVHDFGVMMAVGAMLVIVSVCLLLPGIILIGAYGSDAGRIWGEGRLDGGLSLTVHWVERHPVLIVLFSVVMLSAAIVGSLRLEVESDFTKNFREGAPIVVAYDYVEENLGGAGVWDIMLPAPETIDWTYVQKVHQLELKLKEEAPELTQTLSLADAIIAGSPLNLEAMRFDFLRNRAINMGMGMFQTEMPGILAALHAEDPEHPGQYWFRVMLLSHERRDASEKKALIAKVEAIASEFQYPEPKKGESEVEVLEPEQKPEVTGFFVLLTYLIDSLIADQWRAFLLAIGGITLMMLVALRNVRYALIALAPNVLPVLVVTGCIGLFGVKINMGAAMIAAVSLGLSVDSSLHYIIGFQRALAKGLTVAEAIAEVQQSVGRALIFATVALILGFSVLCFSNFIPTVYFGVLVSLTMLGGLFGNLILLPLLLRWTTRDKTPAPEPSPA